MSRKCFHAFHEKGGGVNSRPGFIAFRRHWKTPAEAARSISQTGNIFNERNSRRRLAHSVQPGKKIARREVAK